MKTFNRSFLAAIAIFAASFVSQGQNASLAVNFADAAYLGTISLDGGYALSQHFSAHAGVRINPWTYRENGPQQFQNRMQTYYLGGRYWPWNVYSGWWICAKGQYQEYNRGGLRSDITEEGDAFGVGIGAGYSLMLKDNINLDFGFGLWGGKTRYTTYECPQCGKIVESGEKGFLLPNEAILSLVYIF